MEGEGWLAVAVLLLVTLFVLAGWLWGAPLLLLPVGVLAVVAVMLWPRYSLYSLYALAPLSVPFSTMWPGLPSDFWCPTEPMAAMLLVLLTLRLLQQRGLWAHELLAEPVFWAITLFMAWLGISALASTMPVVSVKYVLVRLWFVATFFYLSYLELRHQPQRVVHMLWPYLLSLAVVAVYTMWQQGAMGLFDRYAAQHSCTPFFPDHTSYGAALAFALPMSMGLARAGRSGFMRMVACLLAALFAVALVLSFTRAAWLSLVLAGGVWLLCIVRMPIRRVLLMGAVAALLLVLAWPHLLQLLRSTEAESSGGLANHVRSMTNITTDDSNVERINRWSCAWRMFLDRPMLGFGPGTYQFTYAPYQRARYITMASTGLGINGGAHSEYLGLLAEGGAFVALSFIALIIISLLKAMVLSVLMPVGPSRALMLSMLVGFAAYAAHSALNSFLDIDKLAAPFWLSVALFVAMHRHEG